MRFRPGLPTTRSAGGSAARKHLSQDSQPTPSPSRSRSNGSGVAPGSAPPGQTPAPLRPKAPVESGCHHRRRSWQPRMGQPERGERCVLL